VKLGPDFALGKSEAYAGYLPDINAAVTGFSLLHESGIGGAPKYGVVPQMPVVGSVPNPLADLTVKRARGDQGSVGYFKSELENGVTVELAASTHAGFYQYTFPTNQPASIVVDVSHVLPSFRGMNWGQLYQGGSLSIASDGHYVGNGTYNKGWNLAPDWTVYFCGKFDQEPVSARTFVGQGGNLSEYGQRPVVSGGDRLGAVYTFNGTQVTSRVSISWISTTRACEYLDAEIPASTQLSTLVQTSVAKWNQEVFSKITTTDSNSPDLALLYTSLYGMHLLPSNRTGDNPKWQSTEPYYDDIYTFWDLFRCATPLLHVLQPVAYEELLRSIIDVWRHEGWLPDARSSNFNGRTQGGSNADNILADGFVKGVRGQVDWNDAYAAMQTNAEKVPPNNDDPIAPDSSTGQGRGALPDWLQYGYITPKYTRAVTRAVEYAGNDFGLRQVALGLNKTDDALEYLRRSRQWRNHWNPAAASFGSNGFLVPRLADGSFIEQDPMKCDSCYWNAPYYEGKPWEYTMNAHHDVAKLVELNGGNDAFVQRLNTLMDPDKSIFNPGNEPSFTTPYLYNFVGRQDLSVQQSRRVAKTFYSARDDGFPGASDAGAMQSWILWSMIGLYPVTGQTIFLIGSPWFGNLTLKTPGGHDLTIISAGGNSDTSYYVQSLKVNGQPWNKNWVAWDDVFANGGTMDFVLGSSPAKWDTGDLPPSPASFPQSANDNGEPSISLAVGKTVPGVSEST
jgi:predicted alpha-1,2-mannosidase